MSLSKSEVPSSLVGSHPHLMKDSNFPRVRTAAPGCAKAPQNRKGDTYEAFDAEEHTAPISEGTEIQPMGKCLHGYPYESEIVGESASSRNSMEHKGEEK